MTDKLVTTKSCDKIITTFEMNITWYDISDKKPKDDDIVLIKLKGESFISTCKWWDYIQNAHLHRIEWWAYFPTFSEFE